MPVQAHQAIMQSRFGQRQKSRPPAGQFRNHELNQLHAATALYGYEGGVCQNREQKRGQSPFHHLKLRRRSKQKRQSQRHEDDLADHLNGGIQHQTGDGDVQTEPGPHRKSDGYQRRTSAPNRNEGGKRRTHPSRVEEAPA
jgi:hypothetical protein